MGGYSTREVSDLIGMKPDQVRHFVRCALVDPVRGQRGEFQFGFQDVVLLRTAKQLIDADVSARRANRVLKKLQSALCTGLSPASLSSVRVYADGRDVLVHEDGVVWNVESGQGRLDFAGGPKAGSVASLASRQPDFAKPTDKFSSDEWYNLGLDLEQVEPAKAPDAYRRSIEANPKNADAHVNLGRLFQLSGDLKRAKRHYELALEAVSSHQLANYNLGTLFDELEEIERAVTYYRRAPGVPDSHYNLARISELRGDEVSARRHMRAYRQLVENQG